ncbi:hypothetical protein JCM8208_004567 [Rhodotorula glutinis]
MSTSGVSRSWTPGTERRYATTTAPSSTSRRLTRGMKAVLLLALLAILIVAIVPAAVVTSRDNKKQYRAEDRALGYTTVVDGVTTFVQTRTASVVTRSSYRTLDNGDISTALQVVTLPVITVSATAAGSVQQGFETVTVDGQEVIVATVTRFVAGANAFVTRTVQGEELGAATVYRTVFDDLTVVRPATPTSASASTSTLSSSATTSRTSSSTVIATSETSSSSCVAPLTMYKELLLTSSRPQIDARSGDDPLNLVHGCPGLLFLHLATHVVPTRIYAALLFIVDVISTRREPERQHAAPFVVEPAVQQLDAASFNQQHRRANQHDEQRGDTDGLSDQHVRTAAAVEREQQHLGHVADLEELVGASSAEQQRDAIAFHGQHDGANRSYDPTSDSVAFPSFTTSRPQAPSSTASGPKRLKLVHLDGRIDDADDCALHPWSAALPRRLRPRVVNDHQSLVNVLSLDQQHERLATEHDVTGVHPWAPGPLRRVRHRRVDQCRPFLHHHLIVVIVICILVVFIGNVDVGVVFLSAVPDDDDRGVHPGLPALPRWLRRADDDDQLKHKHIIELDTTTTASASPTCIPGLPLIVGGCGLFDPSTTTATTTRSSSSSDSETTSTTTSDTVTFPPIGAPTPTSSSSSSDDPSSTTTSDTSRSTTSSFGTTSTSSTSSSAEETVTSTTATEQSSSSTSRSTGEAASTTATSSVSTESASFPTVSRPSRSSATAPSELSTATTTAVETSTTSATTSSTSSAAGGESETSVGSSSRSSSSSSSSSASASTTSSTSSGPGPSDEPASSSSASAPDPAPTDDDDLGGVPSSSPLPPLSPSPDSAPPLRRHRLVRRHREQPRRVDAFA